MSNVVRLPPTSTMTAAQALSSSLAEAETGDPESVVVIGYDQGGNFVVRSSRMNRTEALWLAEQARRWALGEDVRGR